MTLPNHGNYLNSNILIRVSYIDNEFVHSLDQALEAELLGKYDTFIVPFLKSYLSDGHYIQASTSGSTGKPKVIEIEKDKMVSSALATIRYFNLKPDQKILLCLPTQFIAGKMIWVRALVAELEVVVCNPTSNPIKNLSCRVGFAAMTPHQVLITLKENPEKFDLIDQLIIGGGPVSKDLQNQLQTLRTKCFATYGMTETITHVALKKLNGSNASDLFEGIGATTFESGPEGNLIVKAPHLSKTPIVTNDLVNLVDAKHFEWLGRLDFVINSGGIKLFPEQIEKKLAGTIVQNFFVWKEEDPVLGEKMILVVEGTADEFSHDFNNLEKMERPKATYFIDQFEHTPTGKLDRNKTFRKIVAART